MAFASELGGSSMTDQDLIFSGYTISIRPPADSADGYHVTYTPRGLQRAGDPGLLQAIGNGGARRVVGPFEAVVQMQGEDVAVRWATPLEGLAPAQERFEQDAKGRVRILSGWLDRLSALVNEVESW